MCISWLISFVLTMSICEEREASENYKMKKNILPSVGFEPTTFCLLARRVIHCDTDMIWFYAIIGKLYV